MSAPPAARPSLPLSLSEPGRALADIGLGLAVWPLVPRLPRGNGRPVLVLPGLLADDAGTGALRSVLRRLGHRAHGWGLGRNLGPTAECVVGLRRRLGTLADRYGQPVSLVGWSLGGIYARDLARRHPAEVSQVTTLGSPFALTCSQQTRVGALFAHFAPLHTGDLTFPLAGEQSPMPVPATSIYSPIDGIVHWRACLQVPGPRAENIAVRASHLGLTHSPAVHYALADRLAQPAGQWRPFLAPAVLRLAFPRPAVPPEPAPEPEAATAA